MKGIQIGELENLEKWIDIDTTIDMIEIFGMQGLRREDILIITKEKLKEINETTKEKLKLNHEAPKRKKLSEQLKIKRLEEVLQTITEDKWLELWLNDWLNFGTRTEKIFTIAKKIKNYDGETVVLLETDKPFVKDVLKIFELVKCYNEKNYSFEIEEEVMNEEETKELLKKVKKDIEKFKMYAKKNKISSANLEKLKRLETSKNELNFILTENELEFSKQLILKGNKIFIKNDLMTNGLNYAKHIKEFLEEQI